MCVSVNNEAKQRTVKRAVTEEFVMELSTCAQIAIIE